MALRFHWRLPLGDESTPGLKLTGLPDLAAQLQFCRQAEACGIESVLMAFGYYMPDPIPLVAALGTATERMKYLLAYRPGVTSPTLFVQLVNTLSSLTQGRVALNVIAGHSPEEQQAYGDFLDHDARYARADEFLSVCLAFWKGEGPVEFHGKHYRIEKGRLGTPFVSSERRWPEIYLGGASDISRELAAKHASCWLRMAEHPDTLRPLSQSLREQGVEVGLRLSIIARPTREEALAAARALVAGADTRFISQTFRHSTDSVTMKAGFQHLELGSEWLTPTLWTGAVPSHGASAISLVGTPEEIASALLEYRDAGVTQFILSGWPNLEAVTYFGQEILPRIRARERAEAATAMG